MAEEEELADQIQQKRGNVTRSFIPVVDNVGTSVLPSTKPRSSVEMGSRTQPFFYYMDSFDASENHFSLHFLPLSSSNNSYTANFQSLCNSYGTTLTLIVIIHIIYIYQWNSRSSRKEIATNYDELVTKKQFYRGPIALISHPPVDGGERDGSGEISLLWRSESTSIGSDEEHSSTGVNASGAVLSRNNGTVFRSIFRSLANAILCNRLILAVQGICHPLWQVGCRVLHPLVFGHLSGLPLLAYISHILWQCRALEELYDFYDGKLTLGLSKAEDLSRVSDIRAHKLVLDSSVVAKYEIPDEGSGTFYYRVIIALTLSSLLLELNLLHTMLLRINHRIGISNFSANQHVLSSQHAMSSLTSLSVALLRVYHTNFPYTPPPIIPFIRLSLMSSSGFSLFFSIIILTILSYRVHPITSLFCGLFSGSLWSLGITSFLCTRYWGNILLFSLSIAILLSLKSNSSYSSILKLVLPCLDYVAWNSDGKINDPNMSNLYRRNSRGFSFDESSDEIEIGPLHAETNNMNEFVSAQQSINAERQPFLSHESSTLSSASNLIRGRLPLINSMESDLDDSISTTAAGSRVDSSLFRRSRII